MARDMTGASYRNEEDRRAESEPVQVSHDPAHRMEELVHREALRPTSDIRKREKETRKSA